MIKIFVVIECDICNELLTQIAVAENPLKLPAEIHDLQPSAEERSWQAVRNATVHYCPECLHSS